MISDYYVVSYVVFLYKAILTTIILFTPEMNRSHTPCKTEIIIIVFKDNPGF